VRKLSKDRILRDVFEKLYYYIGYLGTGKRVLSAEQIIQMTTSGEWSGELPVCPKITTTPSTTTKFD